MSTSKLDSMTSKLHNDNLTPQEKITSTSNFTTKSKTKLDILSSKALHEIVKAANTAMLTTRSSEGHLHSRAMTPASRKHSVIRAANSRSIKTSSQPSAPLSCHLYSLQTMHPTSSMKLKTIRTLTSTSTTNLRPTGRRESSVSTSLFHVLKSEISATPERPKSVVTKI